MKARCWIIFIKVLLSFVPFNSILMSSIVVVAIITFSQFSEWVIFYVLFEETSIIKIPPLA